MKCALIGAGMVAQTHLDAIADIPGLSLSAVIARGSQSAQDFAERATAKLGYAVPLLRELGDIPAADTPDFAIIATPPDARLAFVQHLAQANIPILIEKPLERTFEAAQEIVEICADADIPLGVFLQHRVRAASRALKDAVQDGVLGDIATVGIQVPWWRAQSYYDAPGRGTRSRDGGGVVITQAIHALDLAIWVAGPVQTLQATMHKTPLHDLEAEDWASAILQFENGAVGSFTATTAAYPGSVETIRLQGTKAHARLQGGALEIHHLDGRTETLGQEAATGGGADPMAFTHDWHRDVIQDFIACLASRAAPVASGTSALPVHAVIDTMERASASGHREKVIKP
ncbi:MAG: Gfo/Idh/MocA family protein [Roseobacter sp.]